MKFFTLQEANDLIPVVRPMLARIKSYFAYVNNLRDEARSAAERSDQGGGMPGGSNYVHSLFEIGRISTELDEMGIQLKDHSRGLIDFPSMRNDRIILLCWQLDEGDEIEWWHDLEAGFAGRQRL
jgi:hypothetical protein